MSNTTQLIGIYSGTFDPVHVGHVSFALAAAKVMKLESVYFIPEKLPRDKNGATSIQDRLKMLNMAVKGHKNLHVISLPDEQFSIQHTLPLLQKMFIGSELVFMCGSDVAKTFAYRWPGLDTLLQAVKIVIGVRGGDSAEELNKIMSSLQIKAEYTLVNAKNHHLASTSIRRGKHKIEDLNKEVAEYIVSNKLYS